MSLLSYGPWSHKESDTTEHLQKASSVSDVSIIVVWDASFIVNIIWQNCLCPTHQDAREFQSEHLKVGGLEYIEEVEPGNSKRVAYDLGPLAMAAESAAPENTVASEKSAHMTPASWLQQCPWPWVNRQQKWDLQTCTSSHEDAHDSTHLACSNSACEPSNPGHSRNTQGTLHPLPATEVELAPQWQRHPQSWCPRQWCQQHWQA